MKRKLLKLCALACALVLGSAAAEGEIDMLAVDHKLYELGYRDGACNGILDDVTINALRNFQLVNGLEVTGQPDQNTVSLLLSGSAMSEGEYLANLAREHAAMPSLANGSYGENVSRLQRALKRLGYFSGSADGAFGDATQAAVYRFQLANGLRETGVADSAVFIRLYSGEPVSWEDFISRSCASVGDSGAKVRTLQLWLKHKGYFTGECTGRYGDGTQAAVKRFQADRDLDPSGDVDPDTCRALYSDVADLLEDGAALRRGESGTGVDAMCRALAELGYPAHARFNMQSELALMQFQLINDLPVTGVADADTLARLHSDDARGIEDYKPFGDAVLEDENLHTRLYRQAAAQLGQFSELESEFGFVQYAALKCGVKLMDFSQLEPVALGAADTLEAGALVGAQVDGREICGVATSDGAVIYRAESGYIVMGYLEVMEAQEICIYRIVEEA